MNIKYEGGKIHIPELDEITYSQYMDFIADEERFLKQVKSEDPSDTTETEHLISAVSQIVDLPDDIEVYPPIIEDEEDSEELLSQFAGIDEYVSVLGIYKYLTTLFVEYNPKKLPATYECEYKGETYYITPDRAERQFISDEDGERGYTTLEAIEANELQREKQDRIEAKGEDPDGAIRFTYDIRKMAVLLRKEGEKLPLKKTDRIKWIDKRAKHFEQLPMTVVLEVNFFLRTISKDLLTNELTSHFLNPLKSPTQSNYQKKQKKNKG